jgi:hypothetical protein
MTNPARDLDSSCESPWFALDGGCICGFCGKPYRCYLLIPNRDWKELIGADDMVCGACIMKLIENKLSKENGFLALRLVAAL